MRSRLDASIFATIAFLSFVGACEGAPEPDNSGQSGLPAPVECTPDEECLSIYGNMGSLGQCFPRDIGRAGFEPSAPEGERGGHCDDDIACVDGTACIYSENPAKRTCAATCVTAFPKKMDSGGSPCPGGTVCSRGYVRYVCWGEDGFVPPDSPPCDSDSFEGCPEGTVAVAMNNGDYKNPEMLCVCVQPCGEEGGE